MTKENQKTDSVQEDLNDVNNLERMTSTAPVETHYSTSNDAGKLYKNIIKSLANYSKGELFTTEDIRNLIRNEYETL